MKLSYLVPLLCAAFMAQTLSAQTYNVKTEWSETTNPNGVWSYVSPLGPLPRVDWWQRNLGGWTSAQPAWALSEDSNNRLPMFYRSNGTETFATDTLPGDVVIHSWDPTNGVGTGDGAVVWTAPHPSILHMQGNIWMTRDIGRSNQWTLRSGNTPLTSGLVFSGDPYNRANPMSFAAGTGGATALQSILVDTGDKLALDIVRQSSAGDFSAFNWIVTEDLAVTRIAPAAVTLRLGRIDAGNSASLTTADGNALRVCKFLVPNQVVPPINVELSGTSPLATPNMLVFRVLSRMQQSGLFQQTLDLFDYRAGAFDPSDLSIANINQTYAEQSVTGSGDLSRYVSNTNEVRARYRVKQTGPAASLIWCSEHDKAVWLVR